MAMSGKLQSQLAPVTPPNSFEFNKLEVSDKSKVQDKDAEPQVEFRSLLQNSNADTARERLAKKSGDLSAAKTDEEFRSMLAEKANPKRAPKNTLGKDDFMKLFIAQMQSQDPLNPQDSSQMAAQMAQFNGLEQMMNVNKTLETMLQSQTTDRAVGMVDYIGKEVDIGSGMLKWNKNKLTKSTFEVEQPLANAFIEVRDSSGQVISQQDLGNLMPGEHNVKWDGKLKDGSPANAGIYHFSLIGKTVDGQETPIPIKGKVKVTGVDLKTDGGAFFTELGKIGIKDVASVGLQGFEEARASTAPAVEQLARPQGNPLDQGSDDASDIANETQEAAAQNTLPGDLADMVDANQPGGPVIRAPQLATAEPEIESPARSGSPGNMGNLNIPVTIAR
jgi:flagellar basal-body rod modification protein FlgD